VGSYNATLEGENWGLEQTCSHNDGAAELPSRGPRVQFKVKTTDGGRARVTRSPFQRALGLSADDESLFGETAAERTHTVKSGVPVALCRKYVDAIKERVAAVTPESVNGLGLLCAEFWFRGLDGAN